jgi:hypothetical protein
LGTGGLVNSGAVAFGAMVTTSTVEGNSGSGSGFMNTGSPNTTSTAKAMWKTPDMMLPGLMIG